MNLKTEVIHTFWITVDRLNPSILLNSSDKDLVQKLVEQIEDRLYRNSRGRTLQIV